MKISHEAGTAVPVFYVILMIVIVVAVDLIFFRHDFGKRLIANIIIVLAFLVFYLIFLRQ